MINPTVVATPRACQQNLKIRINFYYNLKNLRFASKNIYRYSIISTDPLPIGGAHISSTGVLVVEIIADLPCKTLLNAHHDAVDKPNLYYQPYYIFPFFTLSYPDIK